MAAFTVLKGAATPVASDLELVPTCGTTRWPHNGSFHPWRVRCARSASETPWMLLAKWIFAISFRPARNTAVARLTVRWGKSSNCILTGDCAETPAGYANNGPG